MAVLASDVDINYDRDKLLTPFAIKTLERGYMRPGEKSPQEAFARAAAAYADNKEHAQRIYDYVSKLWFMFATPVLANAGSRQLPISCFLQHMQDSRQGLMDGYEEAAFLSSLGGGVGTYYGDVRSDGESTSSGSESTGIIPFIAVQERLFLAFKQGKQRRGSAVAYLPVDHAEIEEFICLRDETGGDATRKALTLNIGVCIPDKFMEAVRDNLDWELKDPHSGRVVKTIKARDLWNQILDKRAGTGRGEPYFLFTDTVNRLAPPAYRENNITIASSNLCNEIVLRTDEENTAVCCLSSVNLERFDEWENDPLFISDLIRMLDNVISVFVANAPPQLWRAVKSAWNERSIGLGYFGFHSWLQKNMLPFAGPLAYGQNVKLSKHIYDRAWEAEEQLTKEKGPSFLSSKTSKPVRNTHLIAVAPNATSSIICGETSPSIEPIRANVIIQKTLSGFSKKSNKWLEKLLEEKGKNTEEVWTDIANNKGSVQHLDFLSDWEKDVFKTAIEIDQKWIIEHAAARQPFICQSQSINLFFSPEASKKKIAEIHYSAWKKGLKGLYYLRSESGNSREKLSEKIELKERNDDVEGEDCVSCQG